MGTITIKAGEEYYVEAVPKSGGYTASGSWTKSNSHFVITASSDYSCTIRGNTVGSGTLSYWGTVYASGSWTSETLDCYWDVEVENSPISVDNISLNPTSTTLNVGETRQLSATISPSNATNKSVSWSSTDTSVATVSSSGLVTAISTGAAIINCRANDSSGKYATSSVTVGSAPASAGDWSTNGNYNINWYNKNQTEFTLTTNKELAGMAYLVNNGYTDFEGKTIALAADIDLSGKEWIPCDKFKGTFDGRGHTISGLSMNIQSEGDKLDFGFFRTIEKGVVSNLVISYASTIVDFNYNTKKELNFGILAGDALMCTVSDIRITDPTISLKVNNSGGDTNFGVLIGNAGGSSVSRCDVKADVIFERGNVTSHNVGGNPAQHSFIGGLCGDARAGDISYCKFTGNILINITDPSGVQELSVGGIAGRGYKISYCESKCEIINLTDKLSCKYDHEMSSIGGISGNGGSITCCRSIIGRINITNNASNTINPVYYYVGGISGNTNHRNTNSSYGKSIDCYSVIAIVSCQSKNIYTYLDVAGIGSSDTSSKACFSNNDIQVNFEDELRFQQPDMIHFDGSRTFSSTQMQTLDFLGELNLYSMLETDEPVWTQDASGGYPYIAALHVSNHMSGDVNIDGFVNGTDLVTLSNIVLGRKEATATADVNQDDSVNGTDIVVLSNIILGRNKAPRRTSVAGASLSIENFDIKAGETKEMLIDLSNPNDEVTLVQFDLHLPVGLSIKKSGSDLDFEMAGRTSWRKHTLDANEVDGAYRFLLYSSSNTLIEGTSGAIIKVNIVADESYNGGKIMLDNILLVDPNEKETKPDAYEYVIPTPDDGSAKLSVEPFDIAKGETKEMLIDLTNPNDEVTLVQFDLHLPAGLGIQKNGSDLGIDMAGRTSWRKHTLDANEVDGAYRFLLYSSGNTLIDGTKGAVIKVNIVADESYNGGKIVLDNILLVDPNEKEMKPANYEYKIGSDLSISGDANGDGEVNITDVTYIIDKINDMPAANFNEKAADLNGDGEINITDVTLLLDIINGVK